MHKTMTTPVSDTLSQQQLSELQKHLLNDYQHEFPMVSRPFLAIAEKLGTTEENVIDSINKLQQQGYISRVGAVFRANSIGSSTLAAMKVPPERLEVVAAMINDYSEVNHNYQREHDFNLWFVLTASDEHELNAVMDDIEIRTGIDVMYLPMLEDYHIDLGFDLKWI